jgi:chromosome segregation ATPase
VKIRSLKVEQFRKFTAITVLNDFQDGLNVIAGPNEMGKSTLVAAIYAVLFERHRSTNKTTKSFQTAGHDTAPSITITFELSDGLYTLKKRFLKLQEAQLTFPNGQRVDGDEAEEKLQNLLGFQDAGKKQSASSDSLGLWSVFCVKQGESIYPEMSQSACHTIQACLENEVEIILSGGDGGQNILPQFEAALFEILSKQGKPKDHYKAVLDDLECKTGLLAELNARQQTNEADFLTLEKDKRELTSLRNTEENDAIQKERDETKERRETLNKIISELSLAEKDSQIQQMALNSQLEEINTRKKLQSDQETLKINTQNLKDALNLAKQKELVLQHQTEEQQLHIEKLEEAKLNVDKQLKAISRQFEQLNTQEQIQEIERDYQLALTAYEDYLSAKRQADVITIDLALLTSFKPCLSGSLTIG